ncbi:MAG: HU family DNA-binding protein [Proteobacteria bacterium]|nr:HU family DNA-binding protein [Pseudomonadota bacterium]
MATQAEFIDALAKAADITKADADRIARAYAKVALEQGKSGFAALPDLGRFKSVTRPARKARNPRTGNMIDVPAKTSLVLKVSA